MHIFIAPKRLAQSVVLAFTLGLIVGSVAFADTTTSAPATTLARTGLGDVLGVLAITCVLVLLVVWCLTRRNRGGRR